MNLKLNLFRLLKGVMDCALWLRGELVLLRSVWRVTLGGEQGRLDSNKGRMLWPLRLRLRVILSLILRA